MKSRLMIACLLLIAIQGCNKKSDSGSSPIPTQSLIDVQGSWTGTYSTNLIGPKVAVFTLSQNVATVTGSVDIAEGTGSLTGTALVGEMDWSLTMTLPGCVGTFSGKMARTGNTVTTSFNGSDCLGTHAGSGTFSK